MEKASGKTKTPLKSGKMCKKKAFFHNFFA